MDDAYTGKTYPFQTPGTPEGNGGGADLGLEWNTPEGVRLELIANDLLGRMHWRDVPGTTAVANTGVTGTDGNGHIVYGPTLSGRNARRDFTQTLPLRWGLGAEVPWRDYYALASLSHLQSTYYPLLALGWKFTEGWRVQADYDLRFKTFSLRLAGEQGLPGVARESARSECGQRIRRVRWGFLDLLTAPWRVPANCFSVWSGDLARTPSSASSGNE